MASRTAERGHRRGDLPGREDLRLEELDYAVHELRSVFERERRDENQNSPQEGQEQERRSGPPTHEPSGQVIDGAKRWSGKCPGQQPSGDAEDRQPERPFRRADIGAVGAKLPGQRFQRQEGDHQQQDTGGESQQPRPFQSRRSSGSEVPSPSPTRSATT